MTTDTPQTQTSWEGSTTTANEHNIKELIGEYDLNAIAHYGTKEGQLKIEKNQEIIKQLLDYGVVSFKKDNTTIVLDS